MKKIGVCIGLIFFIILLFLSCKTSEKGLYKLDIASQYYQALNDADTSSMALVVGDSILTKESDADYQEGFSNKGYLEWLKWDAVFEPTYKILEIEEENNLVIATISKIDKRLIFLHEEPIIWKEIISFDKDNRIIQVERTTYQVFKASRFIKNREHLVNWIAENHPELNGFLNDQTESGGLNYLKAISLYKNRKE